jgi:FlaA1/EpsC-like NDP-sugar epimerase
MPHKSLIAKVSIWALRLSPLRRRILLISTDVLLISLSVWLSFWLRLADPWSTRLQDSLWIFPTAWLTALPLYAFTGQYKGLTRYAGSTSLYRVAGRNGLLVLLLAMVGVMLQAPLPPRSSWLLLWVLLTALTGSVRFALRDVFSLLQDAIGKRRVRVAIYGAGAAGAQLAASLRLVGGYSITAFLDDAPQLWRRSINGIEIYPPEDLISLQSQIDQVLLAMPSVSLGRRRNIIAQLQMLAIPVLQVPSVEEITSGRSRIDALRPIAIEELLGRDAVPPDTQLLGPGIADQCVCVTGAGGSIGSELCRQILKLTPRRLVLLERSEPSLYATYHELNKILPLGVSLEPVLGSAADLPLVERLFLEYSVNVVFHAAAYKHVPLVESNPLAGLANNVLSTRVVCLAAQRCGLRQMVLISSDKAVRPSNVMGASKRVAELVVQASAQEFAGPTCFSMVRFGNVLGSSGSVVPLFREQIAAGGPLTLTHPDITRYFMTIHEASQLVLQAAVLAHGGDVFLLDMGEPVRIRELAEQMIRLSGLTVRDSDNPDGDIDIVCTGIRLGEKLYEELLISADSEPTSHPLIYRAQEQSVPPGLLWPLIDEMEDAIRRQDVNGALRRLAELVPEWIRSDEAVQPNPSKSVYSHALHKPSSP